MPDRIIDFKPPIKGVDESLPARAQADLTCPDALNVRGNVPSLSDNKTVGKRDGYGKAFSNAAGGGAGAPITGLTTALRASSTSFTTSGNYEPVVERWGGYAIDTPYQGYLNGYNFRGKYVRFSRKIADYGSNGWQGSNAPPGESITLVRSGANTFTTTHVAALSTFTDSYGLGLASSWATSNDMTVTLNCYPRAQAANDLVDCSQIGPFVRGDANLGAFVWAYLRYQSANTVKLALVYLAGSAEVDIATSDDIVLPGSAIISNNFQIRITATATGVEARLTWPDVLGTDEVKVSSASTVGVKLAVIPYTGLGAPKDFKLGEIVTQAVNAATGIVIDDTADTTTNKGTLTLWMLTGTITGTNALSGGDSGTTATAAGVKTYDNARAGWFFKSPGTSYPSSEPGYFRRVSGMDYSNLIPPEPQVVAEIQGTDIQNGVSRYYIPPNWMGVDIDSTQGNPQVRNVGGTTGYSTSSAPRTPSIDTTNDWILGPITDRSIRTGFLTIEVWHDTPPTEHYPVEFKLRDIGGTSGDTDDAGGAIFYLENLY